MHQDKKLEKVFYWQTFPFLEPPRLAVKKYWREIYPLAYAFIVLELCCDLFRPCPHYPTYIYQPNPGSLTNKNNTILGESKQNMNINPVKEFSSIFCSGFLLEGHKNPVV